MSICYKKWSVINIQTAKYSAIKICAPFSECKTDTNDVFIDEANPTYITMHMYNLIEHSDNNQIHQEAYGSFKEIKFQMMIIN